ncbi:unnamed protein product [Orchesella dallaii]|uniref:Uncharacterized protein n=1 Tax=Orchesella dallaii TaxID=48710 RepID=A0ABP1Q525_9HEXA
MAIISGAVRQMGDGLANRSLNSMYILPRPDHPQTLENHAYTSTVMLPTSEPSALNRLKNCNDIFTNLKTAGQERCVAYLAFQFGLIINSIRKVLSRNSFNTCGITNIAGDSNGFSLSGKNCEETIFSVGTSPGCVGKEAS